MDREKFESLLGMAKSMQSIDVDRADFWRGFRRGLQRNYHGENFRTTEEHERWMNCASGEYRIQLQTGYRTGFYCDQIRIENTEDVKPLRKLLGLSSVADLAETVGVSPRTIEGWEQGRQIPKQAHWLSAISLIYNYLHKS